MQVVIVGAGGFAREVACLLPEFLRGQSYTFKGFLGRDRGILSQTEIADPVLGDPESYAPARDDRLILAIGSMESRQRVFEALKMKGGIFLTLVHPGAYVAKSAHLAEGVLIYPFAAVSNNARLAAGVKLNYYASVGHDSRLGAYCLLAPYATVNGFGVLDEEVYMSTHATVAPQVHVGARSKISANSVAMRDVPAESLVFGVPGRVVRRLPG